MHARKQKSIHQRKGWVKRALEGKKSKNVEDTKVAMFIRGSKTSEPLRRLMDDFYSLKKPFVIKFNKKNQIKPFDDASAIEFFSSKNECSLFTLTSHSKKRPDSLTLGRLFNHSILDMVEFQVKNLKTMQDLKNPGHNVNSRTCILFQGAEFDNQPRFKNIANILLDFFCEAPTSEVNLQCLDHILIATVQGEDILLRHYSITLKKSGSRIPRVELTEIGPSVDLELKRTRFASEDLFNLSRQHFRQKPSAKKKNISKDTLGDQYGTLHMSSPNMASLSVKLPPALRNKKRSSDAIKEDDSAKKEESPAVDAETQERPSKKRKI
eukprot:TRINITY_DN15583_c0_g1_i1.p1 TRINITY_DN15583_c0_g1~~TRINITY_DN15583_c0_g1_i1.p1  ORF type:complete len:324 (-),score=91.91 TRINITY_DN15583_c0_g1_i1:35-1006(-)